MRSHAAAATAVVAPGAPAIGSRPRRTSGSWPATGGAPRPGFLGTVLRLRPTLWIAAVGGRSNLRSAAEHRLSAPGMAPDRSRGTAHADATHRPVQPEFEYPPGHTTVATRVPADRSTVGDEASFITLVS